MENHTSYVVTCKTFPVVIKGLENWPAVAPCTNLQLVDMKLLTFKDFEVCLNCWNTALHQGIRTFGGCRISCNLYRDVRHRNFIYVV